jgi:4-amino-4-deoxy-L-arabinose transferase-like glycosyltransferase
MTMQAATGELRFTDARWAGGEIGLLSLLTVVPLLIHLWLAAFIPLTEDEAYYRLWALAPAHSYFDHPPMVAWMMAAGRWLIGDTSLGLRFPGVLSTAISTFALWRTAQLLIGREFAITATAFAVVMPLLAVGAVVMTPDTPSVLFFVLGAWALAELYASANANWWIAVGLFAGLGLVSKYTNFFFGIEILAWLLSTRRNWHWFKSWQLYAGGTLALLLFTPVIMWNVTYDGASFAKQFCRVADVSGFKPVWQFELWGALLLLIGPVIFLLAARGLSQLVKRFKHTGDPAASLLLALTVPLLAYFCLHALHGRVLPNWIAPAYPFFALLAATSAGSITGAVDRIRSRRWALVTSAGLSLLIYAHAVAPFYVSPKLREPTHQLRGWPEFAADVEKAAVLAGAAYVATTSYGTTGQLSFNLGQRWPVFQLNERIRYVHLPPPDRRVWSEPGIVVEIPRRNPKAQLTKRFENVEQLSSLTRSHRGIPLQTYLVYRVSNPKIQPLAE